MPQKLHDLRVDLGHLRQVDLTPILAVEAIIGGQTRLKTLVNVGESGVVQRELQFLIAQNVDHDSSVKSESRVVGSQVRNLTQKAATVLKNMSFASLPLPFRGIGEGAT